MLDFIKNLTVSNSYSAEEIDRIFEELKRKYPSGFDAFGLNLKEARKSIDLLAPIYKKYFRVRVFGAENVQNRHYMIVSNHSGQIAIDAVLICTALALDVKPSRLARPLVERFFGAIPFVGTWATECGAVLGDRQNCLSLLEKKESVVVFPEGVKGVSKSTTDYYKLQSFSHGFFRMAISTDTEVLPVAVIGAEEFYPYVFQAKSIAKKLGLPALPISLNYFPLPSPVDIYFGKPYPIPKDLNPDSPNSEIDKHIQNIEDDIQQMIKKGLRSRRSFLGLERRNINDK